MGSRLFTDLRRNAAACCALLVGLLVTALATVYVHESTLERRQRRFEEAVRDGTASLLQRMDTYTAMLLGARGLFSSSQRVERIEFQRYVDSLEIARRYPGIQGIGFAQWLRPEEHAALEAAVRAEGFRDFHVWPDGEPQGAAAILYLEPFDARNRRAFGFDMFSEPARRAAMERARDTGLPAASARVRLVQEHDRDTDAQAGFNLYVPVYERPLEDTIEARREHLRGFVYATFRMGDLVEGLRFPGFVAGTIALDIYDGPHVDEGAVLYHSPRHEAVPDDPLREVVTVSIAGQPWTLRFTAREDFADVGRTQQLAVAGGGLLVTLLLFLITRSQAKARTAAEEASAVQRRLASEAQAAVHLRDDFLGIAAHELRTPLTSLKLQLQLLQRQLDPGTAGASRLARGVATCERQATRLTELVNSLLDVSRISGGRLELHLEPLDLGEVVHEVARRFELEATTSGASLKVEVPAGVTGRWDRLRLEQVLTNLLSNALKYGRGAPVTVRARADGMHAWLEVEDRGIGITHEDAARIFGRFERAVSLRHYGGLGLGLFITRTLVEALGGYIAVESVPGQGSTFTVTLPLEGPSRSTSPPAPEPPPEPPSAPLQ